MSEAYEKVRGGRLAFKGGELATHDKPIDKKNTTKTLNNNKPPNNIVLSEDPSAIVMEPGSEVYTIDAAKKTKYEELFPVETWKFGYVPNAKSKSVEEALDERFKKKVDRYCK